MSEFKGLYGLWLDKDINFELIDKQIKEVLNKYYSRYDDRVKALSKVSLIFIDDTISIFPELKDKISFNHANMIAMIGRYINDIVHFKIWHEIHLANQSKVLAHTIKWALAYPPISLNLSKDDYKNLSIPARKYVLDINIIYINSLMGYFFEKFKKDHLIDDTKEYDKVFYLMRTGQYDARMAAVFFDGLL